MKLAIRDKVTDDFDESDDEVETTDSDTTFDTGR